MTQKNQALPPTCRKLDFGEPTTVDDDKIVAKKKQEQRKKRTNDTTHPVSEPKRQRGMFQSPTKHRAHTIVVTPPEPSSTEPGSGDGNDKDTHVKTYIHKNVEYFREGEASLSPTTLKVFRLVRDNYEIPVDFENDRSFGPLSGMCYEERLIRAYTLKKLKPKAGATVLDFCAACAKTGHVRNDCPALL
jgi:hypothetical protein